MLDSFIMGTGGRDEDRGIAGVAIAKKLRPLGHLVHFLDELFAGSSPFQANSDKGVQ